MQCWHITGFYLEDGDPVSVDEYVLTPDDWHDTDVFDAMLHHAPEQDQASLIELWDHATCDRVEYQVRDGRLMVSVADHVTDYVVADGRVYVGVADLHAVTTLSEQCTEMPCS